MAASAFEAADEFIDSFAGGSFFLSLSVIVDQTALLLLLLQSLLRFFLLAGFSFRRRVSKRKELESQLAVRAHRSIFTAELLYELTELKLETILPILQLRTSKHRIL